MNDLFEHLNSRRVLHSLLSLLIVYPLLFASYAPAAEAADAFTPLQERWSAYLTGGSDIDLNDPVVSASLQQLDANVNNHWSTMVKSGTRSYLWSDLSVWSDPATISANYVRLREMAIAYATTGSALQGNAQLVTDILQALDWMYANKYNETKSETGNWWHWEIGAPMNLSDTMILVHDQLSSNQIANYVKVLDRFVPDPTYRTNYPSLTETGANRLDKALIVSLRGIIAKSSLKLEQGRDAISQVLLYVKDGDGFYEDGSFIQHDVVAYTGSYGAVLIADMAKLIYLLGDSSWSIADPNMANVMRWVEEAYQPFFYKGAMMDNVRGRAVSRQNSQDHQAGRSILASMALLANGLAEPDAGRVRAITKGQMLADTTFNSYTDGLSIFHAMNVKQLLEDQAVTPAEPLIDTHVFGGMDRALHLRPDFAVAVAMFSTRISAMEYGNGENKKPWWQGAGALYLYNGDQTQYSGAYWPTVDAVRLPGTTTDGSTGTLSSFKYNTSNWAGGSYTDGSAGTTGMQFSMSSNTGSPLAGKKSWFLFGDKVIAIGSDISDTGGRSVETIVENRKLNDSGSNALVVNGAVNPAAAGWNEVMNNVSWAHLSGDDADSNIGYVFPNGQTITGLRETRTGSWNDINVDGSTDTLTAHYLSLAIPAGVDPAGAKYEYVLLPGASTAETEDYALQPSHKVLEQSSAVHAVQDTEMQVVGANFWTDSVKTLELDDKPYLTSSKKSSITVQEEASSVELAVADPTHANGGSIVVELHQPTQGAIAIEEGVTIKQFAPTTIVEIDTAGAIGKTFHIKLSKGQSGTVPASPSIIDAAAGDGSVTLTWSATSRATGYRIEYGTQAGQYTQVVPVTSVSGGENRYTITGLSNRSTYYFTVIASNAAGDSARSNEQAVTLANIEAFSPIADTYVRNGSYANANYGSDGGLVVKNDGTGYHRRSFLTFDISDFEGTLLSAKLRLVPVGVGQSGIMQQAELIRHPQWGETTMTWNNQPAAEEAIAAWTAPPAYASVEIDVTSAVYEVLSADGLLSLRITAPTNQGQKGDVTYASREHENVQYHPVLLLEKESYSLLPAQDVYVRNGSYANTNYGTSSDLVVKNDSNSGYNRVSYLQFDLASLPSEIHRAHLRLVPKSIGMDHTTGAIYEVENDNWTEETMTWSNKPAAADIVATYLVSAAGSEIMVDVTDAVRSALQGERTWSIQLNQLQNYGSLGWMIYGSKEDPAPAKRPVLIIE
ncbi:CBM96 family carbohydrate-binding protein [Paenibacillus aquistagni]|uniref:CBM96 family carbohydrate-binding protein n=1 Tax=Paenibacillus aquistagni TaxID=1852522 RepID=UPI00145A3A2E|nr:polysaccharide lyase family 8 super-sandwich domain-containing protein [Paenibacillus aquistagni]NMM54391.1 DNRLRE domain-containing protein [Paenibacillus aquistagni]